MAEYQLKPGKVGQKVIDGYKKVEEKLQIPFWKRMKTVLPDIH